MFTESHSTNSFCIVVVLFCAGGLATLGGCSKTDPATTAKLDELQTGLSQVRTLLDEAAQQRQLLIQTDSEITRVLEQHEQTVSQLAETISMLGEAPQTAAESEPSPAAEIETLRSEIGRMQTLLSEQARQITQLQAHIAALQKALAPSETVSQAAEPAEVAKPGEPVIGFPDTPRIE